MHDVTSDRDLKFDLTRGWARCHTAHALKFAALLLMGSMAALMPVDYIAFDHHIALQYSPLRVALITIAALVLVILHATPRRRTVHRALLTLIVVVANAVFLAFLFLADSSDARFSATIGTLTVIAGGQYILYRFALEHSISVLVSVLLTAAVVATSPQFMIHGIHVGVGHAVCFALMLWMRRRYGCELLRRYRVFQMVAPAAEVFELVTQDVDTLDDVSFRTRRGFVVCLCSDWRGFQRLAQDVSPQRLSHHLTEYYNVVFRLLQDTVPSGRYYADWHADELFAVFYGDEQNEDEALADALRFARRLATDVPRKLALDAQPVPLFDVGLAAGTAFLGLQGPTGRKKTTVIGAVAGIAARNEAEAKTLRRDFGDEVLRPTIAMDKQVAEFARDHGILDASAARVATAKDILGSSIYLWNSDDAVVSNPGPSPTPGRRAVARSRRSTRVTRRDERTNADAACALRGRPGDRVR